MPSSPAARRGPNNRPLVNGCYGIAWTYAIQFAQGTPRAPNLSPELETLVRALRDAEILAVGNVPASCVRSRYEVW
ncbi:MAG: hypothetical protein P9C48_09030 [Defluviicoccus sp.]|nr:hypothetical protein [Defluviicoccus sp.]MDG4609258.1 hypothetical protein [Defluviicoccus sp.]